MTISEKLETIINNNQKLFLSGKESIENIILFLISTSEQDKIFIPLLHPSLPNVKLLVDVSSREETFFEIKVLFNYRIINENENILDENTITNYYINYGINFDQFFPDIQQSFLDYLDHISSAFSELRLLDIREKLIIELNNTENIFNKLNEIIEPILKKTKNGVLLKEDYKNFLVDFSDNRNFQFEVRDARLIFLEDVQILLKSKNESKTFVIQIGDFIIEHEFLKIQDTINETRRNMILNEIQKGKRSKYEYIEEIAPTYSNGVIKSITIRYSSPNGETFTIGQKFKINKKEFTLEKILIPDFIPIDNITINGNFSNSPDIAESYILSIDSFNSCDLNSTRIINEIPFLKDKLFDFQVIGISYINSPKNLKLKCIANAQKTPLAKGKEFCLNLMETEGERLRFKLFIKNFNDTKYSDIKNIKDLGKANRFYYYHFINHEDKENYIYDGEKGYFIVKALSFENITPICEYPFNFEYLPQIDSSIVFITRIDKLPFFLNDRYILINYYFEEIPASPIKDVSLHLDIKSQEIIEYLKDYNNKLDEFGILYNTIFNDEIIETFKNILEQSYEYYNAPDDLRNSIINRFVDVISSQKFIDGDNRFNINSTTIKKKGDREYRLLISFNFFGLPKETFAIKYKLGEKFFQIDLITENQVHKKLFDEQIKQIDRNFYQELEPDFYFILPKKKLNIISLNEIEEFIRLLLNFVYPYKKDKDSNSIGFKVGQISIISEIKQDGNIIERIDNIYIGEKFNKIAHFGENYFKKSDLSKIIEEINVTKNYSTDKIIFTHFSGKDRKFDLTIDNLYSGYKIKEILLKKSKSLIDLEKTRYYKSYNELYAKIGKKLGDSEAKYYLFKVGDKVKLDMFGQTEEQKITDIKFHFDGNEAIIITDKEKYLLKNKDQVKIFYNNVYTYFTELDSFIKANIHPFCLGLSEEYGKMEELTAVLILFLRDNGNLDQICYETNKENPKYSLITDSGTVEKIQITDDSLFVRITLNGNDYDFEVGEDKAYDIYKSENQKYMKIASDLSIFLIYKNELLLEEPTFEEETEFNINNVKAESFFSDMSIWDVSIANINDLDKSIKDLPMLRSIESILSGVEEKRPEKVGEKPKEKIREEPKPKEEMGEEGKESVAGEISEEELAQLYRKETGKSKTKYRGQDTKDFAEWKVKYRARAKPIKQKSEEKEIPSESPEEFLSEMWSNLTKSQRIELLNRILTLSEERLINESDKDWDDFSYKLKFHRQIEEIKKILPEIQKISEIPQEKKEKPSEKKYKVEFFAIENHFSEIWDNTSQETRSNFLKLQIGLNDKEIEENKNFSWEELRFRAIGGKIVNFLIEVIRQGQKGEESEFTKLIILIENKADGKRSLLILELQKPIRDSMQEFGRFRLFNKNELIQFIFLKSDHSQANIFLSTEGLFKHEIEFKIDKPIQIYSITPEASFITVVSTKSGLLCRGLFTEKDDIPKEELLKSEIKEETEFNLGITWKNLSEDERESLLKLFEAFIPYAEIFKKLKWDNAQLEFLKEELNKKENIKKVQDWLKKRKQTKKPKWKNFISIIEEGDSLIIKPKPESRSFTQTEQDFYDSLYDKINVDFYREGRFYKCNTNDKDTVKVYIENFYEYN